MTIVAPEVWITGEFQGKPAATATARTKRQDHGRRLSAAQANRPCRQRAAWLGIEIRSAFPPENATGNYIKIVQRVPVKIVIDSGLDPKVPLPLGISVTPTVSGAMSDAAGTSDDASWKPRFNPWLIAISVTLAAFMEILDTTIVNVALPHIAGTLSVSNDEATWALTSYLVANGIVLTISGWLGDLLGRKRYFLICLGMFTVCSFLCGIANSLPQLIIFRMMQGFFGGGLQPNQQSIILDSFPQPKRAAAFGITAIATVRRADLGADAGRHHHRQRQLALGSSISMCPLASLPSFSIPWSWKIHPGSRTADPRASTTSGLASSRSVSAACRS